MLPEVVVGAAVVIGAVLVTGADVVIGSIVGAFEIEDVENPVDVVVVLVLDDENSHLTSFSRLQNPFVLSKNKPVGHERIMSLLFTHLDY